MLHFSPPRFRMAKNQYRIPKRDRFQVQEPAPQRHGFCWKDGNHITSHQVLNIVKNACASIGSSSDDIGTHSLRKACVVAAIKANLPDSVTVQIGGWASFASLRSYVGMEPFDLAGTRLAPHTSNSTRVREYFKRSR